MDFSAIKDLYIGSTPVQSAWLNGSKVWGRKPTMEQSIRDAMILWYDIKRQGATNEGMATNPVLRDLSGNGHDATCYNFAWSGMSGIGGYAYDFTTFNQEQLSNCTATKFTLTNKSSYGGTYKNNDWFSGKFSIRVSNFNSSVNLLVRYYYLDESSTLQMSGNIVTISGNGDYEIDGSLYSEATGIVIQFERQGSCDVELLPLYPNALVSDGVDDYAQVTGLPILTKEKGYTVIAKRDNLYQLNEKGIVASKHSGSSCGAFQIEYKSNNVNATAWNFGASNTIQISSSEIIYQTSKSYNGEASLNIGTYDDSDVLDLFKYINQYFGKVALYSFLLFDRDLTEEEIEWVKKNMLGYEEPSIDTSHDNIGVLLTSGTRVPYSQVPAEGYPKEQVVGITYQDGDCAFCVETDDINQSYFCGAGLISEDPEGMLVTNASGTATTDLQGLFNTKTLCAELRADQTLAVNRCRNHQFRNGQMGYLGSWGEYHRLLAKKDVVNDLLVRCGGTALRDTGEYWSSTLNLFSETGDNTRWVWIWNAGDYVDGGSAQGLRYCRPLCEYKPNRTDDDLDVTLVDAWIFSGHDNSEAPKEIAGEKGTTLNTHNFSWNEEGSGFKDGALHFDGVDDYLDCGKTPVLTEYTLIMKRTHSKFGAYACVASKYKDDNLNGAFLFELNYINGVKIKPNQTWNYTSAGDVGATVISQEDIPELISWQTSDSYNGKVTLKKGSLKDGVYFAIASLRNSTNSVTAMSCYWCALYSKSLTVEQIQKEIAKLEALWNSRLNNNNKETSK